MQMEQCIKNQASKFTLAFLACHLSFNGEAVIALVINFVRRVSFRVGEEGF